MLASAVQRIVITAHTQRPSPVLPCQLWGKSPEMQTLSSVCCLSTTTTTTPVCQRFPFPLAREGNDE